MPKISVVVTILNEENTIEVLLEGLLRQSRLPDEVIIVDGGSSDSSVELVQSFIRRSHLHNWKLIQKHGNRSVGRNFGVETALFEWIAITDAGCVPRFDWLLELEKAAKSSEAPVLAGYYEAYVKTPFEEAVVPYVLVMPDRVDPEAFLPATRSMMMRKSVWEELGGFDESLSDNEDYAFARKIQQLHIPIAFVQTAIVTWQPRSDLRSFAYMIYRFARGDAKAGLWRPKVALIFARYLFGVASLILTMSVGFSLGVVTGLVCVYLMLYASWSVYKNLRYVPRGWYYLPLLQLSSDVAVMVGTVEGMYKRH